MKKHRLVSLILMLSSLFLGAGCSLGGSADQLNCSREGEICISLDMVPSFEVSDPIDLKITVTSTKDLADLYLSLHTGTEIMIDGLQTWENNLKNPTIDRGMAYWGFSIEAGQSRIFTRVLHFPSHTGEFPIAADVGTIGNIIEAIDSFYVVIIKDSGQVILPGTSFPPMTPDVTSEVYGPGTPAPTFEINPTRPWVMTPWPTSEPHDSRAGTPYPLPVYP